MSVTKPVIGQAGWGTVLNAALDYLEQRSNHVGTMSADYLADGTVNGAYTLAERTTLGNKQDFIQPFPTLTAAQAAVTAGTLPDQGLCTIVDPTS